MARDSLTQRWMDIAADLGCVVCRNELFGPSPAELHHIREGAGGGQKNADLLVVPLCKRHHDRLHAGRSSFERLYASELDLLAQTIREVVRRWH